MSARIYRAWTQESKDRLSATRKRLYAEGLVTNGRKAPIPRIVLDRDYGLWLSGFVDGEGCFHVGRRPATVTSPGGTVNVAFSIGLRRDDAPVLLELEQVLGFGKTRYYATKTTPTAAFHVNSFEECMALAVLFTEDFPLRGKKRWDAYYWRQIVEWCCATYSPQYADVQALAEYMAALKEDASLVNFEDGLMPVAEPGDRRKREYKKRAAP